MGKLKAHSKRNLDEQVKIVEAVQILGISRNTLKKWADKGRLQVLILKPVFHMVPKTKTKRERTK